MTESAGSLAEEATKLMGAVQEWARGRLDGEHHPSGSTECQLCPFCQGMAMLRSVKPETVEHLVAAASSLAAAFRATVSQPGPPPGPGRVQHIDVREG